jgi:hypothetical protein
MIVCSEIIVGKVMTIQLKAKKYSFYAQGGGEWKTTPYSSGDPEPVGTLIARANWTEHGLTPDSIEGYDDAFWVVYSNSGATYTDAGDFLQGAYEDTTGSNASGGAYLFLEDLGLDEVFIEFEARMPSLTKGGGKFCKVFGSDAGVGYCNTTFGLTNDAIGQSVSFGDGTLDGEEITGNDTHRVIFFSGENPLWTGRNYGLADISVIGHEFTGFIDDEEWHTFKIHIKFHSGTTAENEINNGIYNVNIDGDVYCDARNLFNRHYSNSPIIKNIGFGDWVQNAQGFNYNFRSINVSTGGFL